MKKILVLMMALLTCLQFTACQSQGGGQTSTNPNVTMLIGGFVNLATDSKDPYKKWISDNYKIDISLNATADLQSQAVTSFASNNKPDIVVFDTLEEYNTILEQNVLLEDWTPYLAEMPHANSLVNKPDDGKAEGPSIAKQMMTTKDGKLKGIWTAPDNPTWSLKIREDWANEYRATTVAGSNYPAGNVATNGSAWQPQTPEDLINFARWIKATKKGCYAFTSAGNNANLGTLGNWLPLMWSSVAELPYGIYIDAEGNVNCPFTDGTHELFINYLKQIISEGLIDPSWYTQSWAQKTKTQQGVIGIEWYPGSITTETETYNAKDGISTVDWWKTYALPVAEGYETTGGFMPVEAYVGKIITVSKKCALNKEKMKSVIKFLDDCLVYFDSDSDKYVRPIGYDALRWGIGVENGLNYQEVQGTDYKYVNTKSSSGASYYRETTAGAGSWDWGAWIATSKDKIVHGATPTVDAITRKVVEHNEITNNMQTRPQIGSALSLDAQMVTTLKNYQLNWEYNYVEGKNTDAYATFLKKWKGNWGGSQLLAEAAEQFKEFGLIN